MATILDGKSIAQSVLSELKARVERLAETPRLTVIRVGEDPASRIYVRSKRTACEQIGIKSEELHLPETTREEALCEHVEGLNRDAQVAGILVQLPLPKGVSSDRVLSRVDPRKDVDGFHEENLGKLLVGDPRFEPCTPKGVLRLLESANLAIAGARVVVIGRSRIVGLPLSVMLCHRNATVTIAHSKTRALAEELKRADIVIAAVGRPEFVRGEHLKNGATVIDVGINRTPDGKIVGDCHFESCARVASALTPVPGGVGPMTIAMLLENTVIAAERALLPQSKSLNQS